jgi:hypothetical protein
MVGSARNKRAVDRQHVAGANEVIEPPLGAATVRSPALPDASLCRRAAFAAATKRLTSGSDKSTIDTPVGRCVQTLIYYTWMGLRPQRWESRRTPHATHLNFLELRKGEVRLR